MKSSRKLYKYGIFASVGLGIFLIAASASAKVQGQCAECHTMHNSQGGSPMAYDDNGVLQTGTGTPRDVLLLRGCVSCHTGTNDGTNVIPYVNNADAGGPNYGTDGIGGATLAGGNFYWVATSGAGLDAKGHNVATDSLAGVDGALGLTPPGFTGTAPTNQLTCAGTTGCHGDKTATSDFAAISGSHHADDTTIDGTTVAKSFRFLMGVTGIEDPDWEYTVSSTDHNQYKGIDRTADTDNDTSTISSLCAQCHDSFHNGSGNVGGANPSGAEFGSPWVRHPTDFDMGNTALGSEYRSYGGGTYLPTAPVASASVATIVSTVNFADDTIVTCVSCHRAHGTPNDDLLRWDYSAVQAGVVGGSTGACFSCHTTK